MNDLAARSVTRPASVLCPTRVRYVVLAWLCSLSMLTYIDRVCIMQVRDEIQTDLGITKDQFAWAFSAFALAYALFEVPGGWLGDILGPRKVLARIVAGWSLFTALTGAAWNYLSLLVIRLLFGAAEAGAYPNIARASRNWFAYQQRGFAQGMVWMFGRWGGAVAPLLIGLLVVPFGWRGAFLVPGLGGCLWVLVFYARFRDTPAEHAAVNAAERDLISEAQAPAARPAPLSWPTLLASPTLWCLSIMYFCSNCGWSFFITWVPAYLKTDLKLSGLPLMLASGGPLFFGGIACLLGGFLTDRQVRVWGRRWGRTMQGYLAYVLAGGFFVTALWTTDSHRGAAFAALCLASFVKDIAMAASWSTTIDIGHRYSGTVAGCMNTIGNLGTVVSPPVVAWLSETSWKPALIYSASMFFIAAACWLFVNPCRVIVYRPSDVQGGDQASCQAAPVSS